MHATEYLHAEHALLEKIDNNDSQAQLNLILQLHQALGNTLDSYVEKSNSGAREQLHIVTKTVYAYGQH